MLMPDEFAGDRKDILSHLQSGRDADGNPMGVPELTAEGALVPGTLSTSWKHADDGTSYSFDATHRRK